MPEHDRLTVKEVAERVKAAPSTVRRWLRSARLRGERAGSGTGAAGRSGWRVSATDLSRFLEQRPARGPRLGPEPRGPRGGTMTGYERAREG